MDWTPYQRHLQRVLSALPPDQAEEVRRLRMAPFVSDPETTLRPAPLMVVSMKPYGAPGKHYPFGWEERAARPGRHRWYDGGRAGSNFVREADALLRLVIEEMELEAETREVFNTYAYFYRAADAKQLKSFGLQAVDCSGFHRQFLETIQPRVVLCIGNGAAPSALATYQQVCGVKQVKVIRAAPRILLKSFIDNTGRLVIGVPHLSYVRVASFGERLREIIKNPTE